MEPIIIPLRPILVFIIVLARVGGLVTFSPFWSNQAAPPRVRLVLALVLTLVVMPVAAENIRTPPVDPMSLAVLILGEMCIGLVLGFSGRMIFSALEFAAQILSIQIGLSLASMIDPSTKAQTTAIGTMAQMLGLMVMMGAEGHYWALAAVVASFRNVTAASFTPELAQIFLRLSADALAVGVSLAAPAIIVLLAVEFVIAIAGRAAPQLQVMVLGFPLKIITGIWITGGAMYFLPGATRSALAAMKGGLSRLLGAM